MSAVLEKDQYVGPTLPVKIKCGCGTRSIPVQVCADTSLVVRRLLTAAGVDPQTPIVTHWCRNCKEIVLLTLRDLHMA